MDSRPKFPGLLPPLLKEVGKLAASVASVSTAGQNQQLTASGSATGNPRNKVSLKPGHSLMDWIRLGASGTDLRHVGAEAGRMKITPEELAKHTSEKDAWISIRGRVYNVTDYLDFHPGGIQEMLRGVGRDATDLFDEIHAWVNHEKILAKCYLGVLTNDDTKEDEESSTPLLNHQITGSPINPKESRESGIRSDWIQKVDTLYLIFYTGANSNPELEIQWVDSRSSKITIYRGNRLYSCRVVFEDEVKWPFKFSINYETGKIDIQISKERKGVWHSFGTFKDVVDKQQNWTSELIPYRVHYRKVVGRDLTFLILDRVETLIVNSGVLSGHVHISNPIEGITRPYSPITCSLRNEKIIFDTMHSEKLHFIIRKYPNGKVSPYITALKAGDQVYLTRMKTHLNLQDVAEKTHFLLLAAGTGIAPMINVLAFLLIKRVHKASVIELITFNSYEDDIIFKEELRDLAKRDPRFSVEHVISKPTANWTGTTGHVTTDLLRPTITKILNVGFGSLQNLYIFVCGSAGFTDKSIELLTLLNIPRKEIYTFPA